jgi:putative Holliday junction resolvase
LLKETKLKNMGKLLAFDYGLKRCGVAVTDELQIIASGLDTVASSDIFKWIENYLKTESVEGFVVGLPLQMNGKPSESTEIIEKFVAKLKHNNPDIPLYRVDERFTSKIAFNSMIDSGLSKKKRRDKALVDEISATLILQNYMASR